MATLGDTDLQKISPLLFMARAPYGAARGGWAAMSDTRSAAPAGVVPPPFHHGEKTMPAAKIKPIPDGMHTLTPHLVCAGAADAIGFYKAAFGAIELMRLPGPEGKLMHAMLRIGDSALMLTDEFPQMGALGPKALKGSPVTLHLFVPDVDAAIARAVTAGGKLLMPAEDMFWGDRYGLVEDPFGHRWSIATHLQDLTPEQIQKNLAALPPREC
jgi:uncharacterized glyoxalase superfamily protein PhnB